MGLVERVAWEFKFFFWGGYFASISKEEGRKRILDRQMGVVAICDVVHDGDQINYPLCTLLHTM